MARLAVAEAVEAPTDPANVAMRTVFDRAGWAYVGSVTEYDRDWVMYRITRPQWQARHGALIVTAWRAATRWRSRSGWRSRA